MGSKDAKSHQVSSSYLPITVAIDLDDVLAPTASSILAFSNEKYGTRLSLKDVRQARDWTHLGGTQQQASEKLVAFYTSSQFANMSAIDDSYKVLLRLKSVKIDGQDAFKFILLSTRSRALQSLTEKWVNTHFPHIFDDIIHTQPSLVSDACLHAQAQSHGSLSNAQQFANTHHSKLDVCRSINARFLIDDSLHAAHDCSIKGFRVLLFDYHGTYTWNHESEYSLNWNVIRTLNWTSIASHLSDYLDYETARLHPADLPSLKEGQQMVTDFIRSLQPDLLIADAEDVKNKNSLPHVSPPTANPSHAHFTEILVYPWHDVGFELSRRFTVLGMDDNAHVIHALRHHIRESPAQLISHMDAIYRPLRHRVDFPYDVNTVICVGGFHRLKTDRLTTVSILSNIIHPGGRLYFCDQLTKEEASEIMIVLSKSMVDIQHQVKGLWTLITAVVPFPVSGSDFPSVIEDDDE